MGVEEQPITNKHFKPYFNNASMIFVGSKVFTHARYWQIKKYVCMIFLWGGTWGGTDNLWGARAPQAPVATPLPLFHY